MDKVSENAVRYFNSGFNCAEAVLRAVAESVTGSGKHDWYKLATPFGGGVGGSHEELCGALTGGVMAIGYFAGRDYAHEDAGLSKALAVSLRSRFIEMAGCTRCQSLLDSLGPQEGHEKCADLVAGTAQYTMELLEKNKLVSGRA